MQQLKRKRAEEISRHFWEAAIKKTGINSEVRCITGKVYCHTMSGDSQSKGKKQTIHLILCMLLCLHPPHPSLPLPPPEEGIPCMCSTVPSPPTSPILPPSSNIHPLLFVSRRSLLPGLWLAGTQWWMYVVLFVSEVFIVSLHYSSSHHHTVKRKWPETPGFFLGKSLEVLFLDWQ